MMELIYLILRTFAELLLRAYALPLAIWLVTLRNRTLSLVAGKKGKDYVENMSSDLEMEIEEYRSRHITEEIIAVRIMVRLFSGAWNDILWCAPFVSSWITGEVAQTIYDWGGALRHRRIPSALVAGVTTLALMNYSLAMSSTAHSILFWIFMNTFIVFFTVILSKLKKPNVQRVGNFFAIIGIVMMTVLMIWATLHFGLLKNRAYVIFILSMISFLPIAGVADKPMRNRILNGRYWLLPLYWSPFIVGRMLTSWLMYHSLMPTINVWIAVAFFALILIAGLALFSLAAYVFCWVGFRGGGKGLSLVAAGIRRFR